MTPAAVYSSQRPLHGPVHFVSSLTDADGCPVINEVIRVALIGDGTLEGDWEHQHLPFVFLTTDERGQIHYRWECADGPSAIILNASCDAGSTLTIEEARCSSHREGQLPEMSG